MDLSSLLSAFSSGFGEAIGTSIQWISYFFIATAIIGGLWGFYIFFQYKYKVELFIQRNVGDGKYQIGKLKNTRIREKKIKGVRVWRFFLTRKNMQPLEDKYILPGNKIKLFKVGDSFIPANIVTGNPEIMIEPIPMDIKLWQSLEMSQAASEYQDLRSKLMPLFITMGTIIACLIFAGIIFYFTYDHANQAVNAINTLNQNPTLIEKATEVFRPG